MKFIADAMLGRLARWLRLLGYDALYYPQIEDGLLLRIAREENRILLTRDTRLVKVRGVQRHLLLSENNPFEQLKKVIAAFNLKDFSLMSRCAECNASLTVVPKENIKNFVPEYVYRTSDVFKQCEGCGKLYWKGTHPEKFKKKLSEVLRTVYLT